MKMKRSNARVLLEKYAAGKCTPEETAIVESWYLQQRPDTGSEIDTEERFAELAAIRNSLLGQIKQDKAKVRRLWPRIAAAASVLLALTAGYLYWRTAPSATTPVTAGIDIGPGGNKAILTLANGGKVNVSQAKNGQLAIQGSDVISKTANGQITYQTNRPKKTDLTEPAGFNTLSTPAGGQYGLVLSDGTRVFLNARSSLTYPTRFTGKDRTVVLTGEAYFEVAHDTKQIFYVKSRGQLIEDIGTQFNVNAYEDERSVKTTLIEGRVKITVNKHHKILVPGQQAVSYGQDLELAKDADMDEATSWKEGYFNFNTETLETAMKKIARWYDVEIEYKNDALRGKPLGGTISKYKNVSQILKKMELTGAIHFKLTGRKIIVE